MIVGREATSKQGKIWVFCYGTERIKYIIFFNLSQFVQILNYIKLVTSVKIIKKIDIVSIKHRVTLEDRRQEDWSKSLIVKIRESTTT